MSKKEFHFSEEEFVKYTEYQHLTNDVYHNELRAKIIGIEASKVQVAPGANVRIPLDNIGENSFIGLYCYLNGDVTVGKNVLIGPHCSIVAGNHTFSPKTDWFSSRSPESEENSVVIGDGSWLASGVTVTPGVKIGRANLICAGAVVTKSTEDYAIMAGVPAKKIGRIDRESGEYIWEKK